MSPTSLCRIALVACIAASCARPAAELGATAAVPATAAGLADVARSSDLPAPLPTPLPGDPMGVTIHRLSNGMTVYVSTDRSRPRFAAWIAVRAGSRMDPAASTGLAHYLEHMLFKGTSRLGTIDFAAERPHLERVAALYRELRGARGEADRAAILRQIDAATQAQAKLAIPNDLDNLYAALGITEVNAFTSDEQTVYVADVPRNRLEAWALVEAERLRDAQFRLFWPELESVYEEKNTTLDNPVRRVFEALGLALFPRHPYGTQPTIGTVDHLKTPAYDDMVAYFHRWYVPNNMAILLAGDVDAATALPVLERAFGGRLAPRPLTPPEPGHIEPPRGRVEVDVVAKGEEAVYLAWLTVPALHPDRDALEVMDLVFDNSVSGLLDVDLVLTQKVPTASSGASFDNEAGSFVLTATAREGQRHADLEALLRGEIRKLQDGGGLTQAELDAVVLNAEIEEKRKLESNAARVEAMTEAYVAHEPWPRAAARLERLRAVTVDDVVRVARRYLGDDYVAVRRVRGDFRPPKITKPPITPVALDPARKSALATEALALPAAPIEPVWLIEGTDYRRATTPAGGLLAVGNPTNDLFAISYRFDLGERREPLLCHALDLLERSGSGELPPDAFARRMYAMGTSIDVACDTEQTTITVSGIDRNLEASVALLDGWLRRPRFEAATVDALVATTISQRKDQVAEPSQVAAALAGFAQRGADSRFLRAPSNAALRAASPAALRRLLAALPDRQHRTTYFGPRAADDAARLVALGRRHRGVAAPPARRYRPNPGPQVFVLAQPTAQSQVRIAMPGDAIDAGDRALAQLYDMYVGGGMGSLIFQEIREARGLAYAAWGAFDGGGRRGDQAALVAGLGTQGDKTLDALTTMLGLLEKTPVTAERMATAKEAIEQGYRTTRIEPRRIAATVQAWDDLGEPDDPRPRERAAIEAADGEALAAFARRVGTRPAILSIAGDASRFDVAALARLGRVIQVEVGQLFSY